MAPAAQHRGDARFTHWFLNSAGGNRFIRSFEHTPFKGKLRVATWNVEGLSDIKVYELINFMRRQRIDILCMQETHILHTPYYRMEDGSLIIPSGSSQGGSGLHYRT